MLRVLRLLRLLRLQKLMRYLQKLQDNISSSATAGFKVAQLTCAVLLFLHIDACCQFGIPSLQNFPDDSWTLRSNLPVDELPSASAVAVCYTHSFFNALSHMMSIGYGVVPPERVDEMVGVPPSAVKGVVSGDHLATNRRLVGC